MTRRICNAPVRMQIVDTDDMMWKAGDEYPPASIPYKEIIRHCEAEAGHAGEHYIYQNGNRWLWRNERG